MEERSGIDMLEEVLRRLDTIENKLNVLDQNVKAIANSTKMADLINKASGTSLDGFARAVPKKLISAKEEVEKIREGFKHFKFETSDAAKAKSGKMLAQKNRGVPGPKNIMVQGKMIVNADDKSIPLPSVTVKIYDEQDKLVKETRTNRAGHWMSQLPPGKYVALFEGELHGKKLVPQNRNFEVPEKLPEGKINIEVS